MPRQVDHAQRRRQIAEAVWSVVASRGLDAVSLREVAAEAGVSMGRVQHYFGSKDAMVLHACRAMAEVAYERAVGGASPDTDIASTAGTHAPRQAVRDVLLLGIPHDDAHRRGAGVWFAFVVKAAVWPELAAVVRDQLVGAHTFLASALEAARGAGHLAPGIDPTGEAVALLALADGLVLRVMTGALDPDTAVAVVDSHLGRVFAAP